MKTAVPCSILVLLAAVCSAMAVSEPNGSCGCLAKSEVQSSGSSAGKLIHCNEIMKGFENGENSVKVIVNLAEPVETKTKTDWHSNRSMKLLHDEIKAIQTPVLSSLSENEFKLRHCFDNQAGFSGEVTLKGLEKLKNDARVISIEPVYLLEPHLRQGIPLMRADIYRSSYNGAGTAIAICDTGIDYRHPMLGNGGFPNSKVIGGYDFGDNDSDPFPSEAHGTNCAGIAAGDLGNVGDYIGGVAYNAKLYALKITSGSSGSTTSDAMVAAWDWCVTHQNDDPAHPILAISTSFGGGRNYSTCDSSNPSMTQAANDAVAAGITVLASSGNDGYCDSIAWPACISSVISVGAVYDAAFGTYQPCVNAASCATKYSGGCSTGYYASDNTAADMVTSYSNTASFLTVLAPSNQCYTTDIIGSGGYSSGDYYSAFGGTSAACPYAAGTVACLQSAAKTIRGSYLSPSEVRTILTSTGDNITDGKVAIIKPRINLQRAIDSIDANAVIVEYEVSAGNDDAYSSGSVSQNATNGYLQIGRSSTSTLPYYMSGMRFTNISIPSFSQIVGASLKICSYSSNFNDTVYGQIQGEAADNAVDFSAPPPYLGSLAKTTASVNWDLSTAWVANTWYISPDISAVVQEIIDRPGWSAGNALAIIYSTRTGSSKNRYRNFSSYDRGSSYAPRLEITYIGPVTLTTSSTAGGSVTTPGQGSFNYKQGTVVNLAAAPQVGYHFVNWTGTSVTAGKVTDPNSASTTITMDANYTAAANFAINQYDIDGTVTFNGAGLDGVTLTGLPSEPITSGGGLYITTVNYGWSGTVTPTKTGYTFTPGLRTYNNVAENHSADDYTAILNTYTISGYVRNWCSVPVSGVSIGANNSGGHTTTDVNGYYEIGVDYNWAGAVTPAKNYYTFDPNSMSYANVLGDVADQNYVANNIYDLDCNGSIGFGDLAIMCENWLDIGPNIPGDFYKDDDNIVNFSDFADFALIWQNP